MKSDLVVGREIDAQRGHLRRGLDEACLVIAQHAALVKCNNNGSANLAIDVQRRYIFEVMIAIDHKFFCRMLGITDLWRHKSQPFLEPLTFQRAIIAYTI